MGLRDVLAKWAKAIEAKAQEILAEEKMKKLIRPSEAKDELAVSWNFIDMAKKSGCISLAEKDDTGAEYFNVRDVEALKDRIIIVKHAEEMTLVELRCGPCLEP